MGIKVTGSRQYILMLEHLAEQDSLGQVEDYIEGLIDDIMWAHPAWRECNNEGCFEFFYPITECVPVSDGSWKDYRVRLHPVEKCPACGKPTRKAPRFKRKRETSEVALAFREGRFEKRDYSAHVKHPRQFDGHLPTYAIAPK